MIDQQQIRALAYLAARMRPHGSTPWDEPGVVASLAKVAHLSLAEVVMATTRAAANPACKSPGVIPVTTGEHWREHVAAPTHNHPPRAAEACDIHPAYRADNCGGCAVDARAYDGRTSPPRAWEPGDAAAGAAAARAALVKATTEEDA